MDRRTFVTTGLSGLAAVGTPNAFAAPTSSDGIIQVSNGIPIGRVKEAVFFPFDRESMPFSNGLRLTLISGKKPGVANPIVMGRGGPGSPDEAVVRFYGTIIPFGEELRMWYMGRAETDPKGLRVLYATSKDGIHWVKPNLGLVEFKGGKANNIVNMRGGAAEFAAIPMLYDPEDTDSSRRFKMVFESGAQKNHLSVAYSPDGFNWKESPNNPVGRSLEPTGIIRLDGCYYVNGQGGWHYGLGRKLVTYASYDFEHWADATCMGFARNVPPNSTDAVWNSLEEAHLGAGMWDRGNVILGIYDMWHGTQDSDRGHISMDLGFLVTHDALQFYEPISNFRILPGYEELLEVNGIGQRLDPPNFVRSTVSHGQGMFNWGDKTMLWYEFWGAGGVRLTTWPRDRIGCFHPIREDLLTGLRVTPSRGPFTCITCPLEVHDADARVYINAAELSEHTELHVELLDKQFRRIDGYSGNTVVPVREAGLRTPVRWSGRDSVGGIKGPFRIQVSFAGLRPEDAQLYAVYVG